MRANVFIASRRSEEGSRLLWRNVPVETAKRLCPLEETCWAQSMLVWAYCDSLGLHPGDPVREGAAASSALEAALARERRLAQEVERLRGAFYRAMTALKEAV